MGMCHAWDECLIMSTLKRINCNIGEERGGEERGGEGPGARELGGRGIN